MKRGQPQTGCACTVCCMPCGVSAEVFPICVSAVRSSVLLFQQAQCCTTNMAAVLGAVVSESLHSSPVQPSSTVCAPAPAPVWQSPPQRGVAVPLQHRLCQDDCIRPVRRFPVNDLPTLRVNFSKEVRRPCSVSAGCFFLANRRSW